MNQTGDQLSRFIDAQHVAYARALAEIRAGGKRSHWIWFVFPQLRGLGVSPASQLYGVADLAEARAYLAHPLLGARLREAVEAMTAHRSCSAAAVLGDLDAMKFRSCLTLFTEADASSGLFSAALDRFFEGERDVRTIRLLRSSDAVA